MFSLTSVGNVILSLDLRHEGWQVLRVLSFVIVLIGPLVLLELVIVHIEIKLDAFNFVLVLKWLLCHRCLGHSINKIKFNAI